MLRIYIVLYHAVLKALLHQMNETLFYKGKEMVEFESELASIYKMLRVKSHVYKMKLWVS